jgi:hypothetical protein
MKIVVNGIWPIPEELKTKNCLAKTQRRKGTQREEFGRGEAGFTADVAYCVADKVNSTGGCKTNCVNDVLLAE